MQSLGAKDRENDGYWRSCSQTLVCDLPQIELLNLSFILRVILYCHPDAISSNIEATDKGIFPQLDRMEDKLYSPDSSTDPHR